MSTELLNREGREEREDVDVDDSEQFSEWIAIHVMGWTNPTGLTWVNGNGEREVRHGDFLPMYDPWSAMAVLHRCSMRAEVRMLGPNLPKSSKWRVWSDGGSEGLADTLELAICLFAKALFSEEREAAPKFAHYLQYGKSPAFFLFLKDGELFDIRGMDVVLPENWTSLTDAERLDVAAKFYKSLSFEEQQRRAAEKQALMVRRLSEKPIASSQPGFAPLLLATP